MWGSSVTVHLPPHWFLDNPSGVQSKLFVSVSVFFVFPYILPSVYPYLLLVCFFVIIHAAHNCAQRMQPQAKGSNSLNVSIICLSVRTSVPLVFRRPFHFFVFILIYSVGVQRCVTFIPLVRSSLVYMFVLPSIHFHMFVHPSVHSSIRIYVHMFFRISIFLSLCPVVCIAFWRSYARP